MKALRAVLIGLVATLSIGGVAACGSNHSGAYYDTICVDPLTQIRMPDYYCLVGNPYYHPSWIYYVPHGYLAPAYNVHITNYNTHNYQRPSSGTIHTGGVPSAGGKATTFKTGNTKITPPRQAPPPDKVTKNGGGVTYKPKNPAPRPPAPRPPAPRPRGH